MKKGNNNNQFEVTAKNISIKLESASNFANKVELDKIGIENRYSKETE